MLESSVEPRLVLHFGKYWNVEKSPGLGVRSLSPVFAL